MDGWSAAVLGRMDRWMDGWMDGWMDEVCSAWVDGCAVDGMVKVGYGVGG